MAVGRQRAGRRSRRTGRPRPRATSSRRRTTTERDVVVLYGGDLPAVDPRQWEWDGRRGVGSMERAGRPGCAARHERTTRPGRTVLYGGDDGQGQILNDTWAWDGTRWARLAGRGTRSRPAGPRAVVPTPRSAGPLPTRRPPGRSSGTLPPRCGDTWVTDGDGVASVGARHRAPERLVNAQGARPSQISAPSSSAAPTSDRAGRRAALATTGWEAAGAGRLPARARPSASAYDAAATWWS